MSHIMKQIERIKIVPYITTEPFILQMLSLREKEDFCYCDVITCAAPNKRAAQRYCNVSDEENSRVLESRIDFILDIAKRHKIDILVLGAFGCGVFRTKRRGSCKNIS